VRSHTAWKKRDRGLFGRSPGVDCLQELRGSDHANKGFAFTPFNHSRQLEVEAQQEVATIVLRAPEVERVEQLVSVDLALPLIGAGNSLKFKKASVL